MKYKLLVLLLIFTSCAPSLSTKNNIPYNSKGFAYIYNESDYISKIIKIKMNTNQMQIAHNRLRPGTLIKVINPKTNDSIILKNYKKTTYPSFYKILITDAVANKINIRNELPFVEVLEIKKNKSFVAEKTKIYVEEKKIYSNAPVELVKIDNISKNKSNKLKKKDRLFIVIADFYSSNSAISLKKRITNDLTNFNNNKLFIKRTKTNKITLLSGPYNSINSMKNDYIALKDFGFEELEIDINE
tara:strand:+ start:556 stop:1287 length:732 start_codon:yes stop_codon:yes gene_type:complete